MNKVLLYDNSFFVPQDINRLLGVNCFSDIYYRKRSLDRWVSDICAAAGIEFVEIGGDRSVNHTLLKISMPATKNLIVLYMPAYSAFGCTEEEAILFVKKLSLTRTSILVCENPDQFDPRNLQIAAMVGEAARALIDNVAASEDASEVFEAHLDQMVVLKSDVNIIDMRDPLHFTDYLTSNFDVRFFNSVQTVNDFVVLKRSSEVEKLRREYCYYSLLPPSLQMFFIQPYDFLLEQQGKSASYRMERLFVPDMALQWIHGSLDQGNFDRFLDKIFYYILSRPVKVVTPEVAKITHQDVYRAKVTARLDQFKKQAEYQIIRPYLDANFDGVDALFQRYFSLLDRYGPPAVSRNLCIGHGDLCFSNILYSKTTGLMRFIDPKGANGEEDIYVDPFYDLAKLSHSVVGNYDFINYGLYRLEINADLALHLSIEPGAPAWARTMFEERLHKIGIDPVLIRLFEASLFLSMVPLHIDAPKKVLAFLKNADQILTELETVH